MSGSAQRDPTLRWAERIARLMERFRVDPLLGLVLPGAGDALSGALGAITVVLAWRSRAPKILIARMLVNLAVDSLVGLIPIVGDLWDFFFRAHDRNLALLRKRLDGPRVESHASDWLAVGAALALFIAAMAIPFVVLGLVIARLGR